MREEGLSPRDAAVKAMREVTSPIIAIVLTLVVGLRSDRVPRRADRRALSAVRRDDRDLGRALGHRRADALACAVRADPQAARGAEPLLRGVQRLVRARDAPLHGRRLFHDSPRRCSASSCSLGMVAVTAWLWRCTPTSLVPDEDQGYYISAVILPGRGDARAHRPRRQAGRARRSAAIRPTRTSIAFTGFDFIGGGYRNNAATIFVTQKHWDERDVTAAQLVGELFGKTAGIREALVLAFNPPPIFGLGNTGGYEFYIQNRGEGDAKKLAEVAQTFIARANQDPMLGGATDAVARNIPAAERGGRPREGEDARHPRRRRIRHAVRDDGNLLRQRLQQVRTDVAGADVRGTRVPHAARRYPERLRARAQR